jgi:hypothetical protein
MNRQQGLNNNNNDNNTRTNPAWTLLSRLGKEKIGSFSSILLHYVFREEARLPSWLVATLMLKLVLISFLLNKYRHGENCLRNYTLTFAQEWSSLRKHLPQGSGSAPESARYNACNACCRRVPRQHIPSEANELANSPYQMVI